MTGACPSCGTEVGADQRFCGDCGSALSKGAATTFARTVTIVTSDLQGSTALGERLDPESLREVMTTYIDEMRLVFERHGGTIEKIIGDAIVAVFGLPKSAEDDALRAVEAAAESLRAMASLNDHLEERWGVRLIVRTGVASGDVVVGEASAGQHVLTGPTVAIATAMEQNAPAQEVLLAESTFEAARDAIEVEPMAAVTPKGTTLSIPSYRLVSVVERTAPEGEPADLGGRICRTCGTDNADEGQFCTTCGSHLSARQQHRETRKTVTVIFADPKPSSVDGGPLDPERLRDVMSRYFDGMQRALEGHGATVEKFIGDAVMAVFGLPIRHEDDALRAVRAAREMQEALASLNAAFEAEHGITLANHIGVNTGEVVAGDASLGQRLVTGDTVNVAARLEQAAGSREILLGPLTHPARPRCRAGGTRGAADAQGQIRAGSGLPIAGGERSLRRGPAAKRYAHGGPGAGDGRSAGDVESGRQGACVPTGDGGRRCGRGQDQARHRVHIRQRRHGTAHPRPMPPLRRWHHVLAVARDRARRVRHPGR